MSEQYETQIGERSVTLSRGQRQRIAIARAALSRNPILLLDEPLAGLDENNAAIVVEALLQLAKQKTVLLVTHNLQFASRMDRIVFIKDGEAKEIGTHDELMRQGGQYCKMYGQQLAYQKKRTVIAS